MKSPGGSKPRVGSRSTEARKLLADWGIVRSLSQWYSDRAFRRWRKQHPGGSHATFYAAQIERKLASGKAHATLGAGRRGARTSGAEWTPETFATRGLDLWQQFLALGLEPGMRCVDYGCGSLRLGQHAIRYLDRGSYFGIDVTASFYEAGKRLLGETVLADKQPRFAVLSDAVIADIARWRPAFIFSNAVLTHVPPDEQGQYFARLETMMNADTRAFVTFVAAPRLKRLRSMTWAGAFDDYVKVAAEAAPSLRLTLGDEVDPGVRQVRGGERQMLHITRHAAPAANPS